MCIVIDPTPQERTTLGNYSRQVLAAIALMLASVSAAAQGSGKDEMAMEKGTRMVGGQAMYQCCWESLVAGYLFAGGAGSFYCSTDLCGQVVGDPTRWGSYHW